MQNRLMSSVHELRSLRALVTCALLVALYVVLNSLSIYITPSIKLTFAYLALGLLGYRFGPFTATLAGLACDLVAYIVRPQGPLHLGLTLSTMLTCLVFALFLYRREFSLWRVIASRAIINVFINIILNTYWLSQLYGKGYIIMLADRFLKNIVLLPLEICLLYIFIRSYVKVESKLAHQ